MNKTVSTLAVIPLVLTLFTGCSINHKKGTDITANTTSTTVVAASSMVSGESASTDWKPTVYTDINNFDGVSMIVKNGTESDKEITLEFKNSSSSNCIYGESYGLEKKINGEWFQVPVAIKGNYGFTSIGYNLASGDEHDRAVNWEWLYGSLDAGSYRIVKDMLDFRGTGDYDTYFLAAEFTIE